MGQVVGNQFGDGKRTVDAVASVNADGQIIGSSSAPVQVAATTPLPTTNAVIDSTGQPFNLDACTHVYARNILGRPLTDTATDGTSTWVKTYSYDAQLSDVRREYLQRDFTALEAQYADTIRLQKKADDAQAKATIRINRMVADRASLQSAVDGLRGDLAENSANYAKATEQARANYTAAISAVLADVARVAGDISSKADGHVIDIQRLHEQWPE